jgi:hydroxymethylpyrimidine/phosphomethylpyrimidine kinase
MPEPSDSSPEIRPTLKPPVVLSFAGADPSGGAGLIAHIQTINRHGCYPMGVTTLQTVQDTHGVHAVLPCDPQWVKAQALQAVGDIIPQAILVSAVGSLAVAKSIVEVLETLQRQVGHSIPIVLDTVLRSTSGSALLAPAALPFFCERLLPMATVITPNVPEFHLLMGQIPGHSEPASPLEMAEQSEADTARIEASLLFMAQHFQVAVYLKGGHWSGEPVDRLAFGGSISRFAGKRLATRHTHGTGCALAAAMACHLAQGRALPEAGQRAHAYVARALATAPGLGHGHGPLNLLD